MIRILIVDDNQLFREGLQYLLAREPGFEVAGSAGSVREALAQALSLNPDVVLLGLALPDGDGLEALRELVARQPGCRVVIVATGESDDRLIEAFRSGAAGYITQATSIAGLVAALHALAQDEMILPRALTDQLIREFFRLGQQRNFAPGALDRLSPRELEVWRLIAGGSNNHHIAQQLYISENTVKVHVRNIMDKLGLNNRAQLTSFARGWTPGGPLHGPPRAA